MTTDQAAGQPAARVDPVAVAAVTVCVYLLAQLIHEGLGHGAAALLAGARVTQLTNSYLDYDATGVSAPALRAIAASGTLANVVAGALALLGLRVLRAASANLRYFLWLLAYVNLFKGFGYLLLAFAPVGDWRDVLQGLPLSVAWMAGLTAVGLAASMGVFHHAARTLDEFAGGGTDRRRRGLALTLLPWALGGAVNVSATVIGQGGVTPFAFSAALATFGGTWLLVWVGFAMGQARAETPQPPANPSRNTLWLALGTAALLAYFIGLGPGLLR